MKKTPPSTQIARYLIAATVMIERAAILINKVERQQRHADKKLAKHI
jgi:hypothetical protein